MKFFSAFSLTVCMLLFACDNSKSPTTASPSTESPSKELSSSEALTEESPTGTQAVALTTQQDESDYTQGILYPWVDKLNIRATPDPSAQVVATAGSKDPLEALGAKSPQTLTYVLRGGVYMDHWYKVKTTDGPEGWIFGGAVKRQNEQKGNAPITSDSFDFPHFGKFDLANMDVYPKTEEGGDATCAIKNCEAGDVSLTIDSCYTPYGYRISHTYVVYRDGADTLKTREFYFDGWDLSQDEGGSTRFLLTETVEDFNASPPKRYTRKQLVDQHYNKLNTPPLMALGEWEESVIE